jgi:hypothetical protein
MNNNKNIKPLNNKGQAHGYWEWYWTDSDLMYKGFYENGKEVGYEEYYFHNIGGLTRKKYYL